MLTHQQIFDTVLAHLRKQGKPAGASVSKHFACRYRQVDPDHPPHSATPPPTLKCAVGVLIPDDKYEPEFEDHGAIEQCIEDLPDTFPAALLAGGVNVFDDRTFQLLDRLQCNVHDMPALHAFKGDSDWLPVMEEKAKTVAAQFALVYTPPVTP